MSKKVALGLIMAFILIGNSYARDTVEFEGRYWVTDLEGKARVVESGIGDKFDYKSDLGIGDQNFPEGRVYWHTGPNSKIRLSYTQAEFEGDRTVTRSIEFKGQAYSAGARVVSDLDVKYFALGWIWQFMNMVNDKIKLGTIVEAKGLSADVSLKAPDLSPAIDQSEQLIGGLPTLGLALDISPIKEIDIFAEASGLGAGNLGYFFDAEAGIKLSPIKYFSILAGYRFIRVKAEDSSNFANLDLKGPFFGGTLRF